MLEEYQQQSQQIQDQIQQVREMLEQLTATLEEHYPPEERTWRMGQAMTGLSEANHLVTQALARMQSIEWPTEERPR